MSWSSAPHQLWLSAAQNNHVANANPIDNLAAVAAFVLESQQALLQHHQGAPLDVASRLFQQRSRFQHPSARGARDIPPMPPVPPGMPPAGTAQVPQTHQEASPAGTQTTSTTDGDGSVDESPQEAEWDTAAISDSVGRAVSAAMSGQSPEGFW